MRRHRFLCSTPIAEWVIRRLRFLDLKITSQQLSVVE